MYDRLFTIACGGPLSSSVSVPWQAMVDLHGGKGSCSLHVMYIISPWAISLTEQVGL